MTAWDLVRRGTWHFHQVTRENHLKARELFRQACRLDPELPEAHLWLGRVSAGLVAYGWSDNSIADLQQGVEAALKALSLSIDPLLAAIVKTLPEESAGNAAGASGDSITVKEPLIRLKKLLEADDGEAADYIVNEKSRLKGVLTPAEIKMLSERIGNFDFHAALKCISDISARLSLDLQSR